jgi:hypothetical protein
MMFLKERNIKIIILVNILILLFKSLIPIQPIYDSQQYIELSNNVMFNAKYFLYDHPNRFSPIVPFWYGLFTGLNLKLSIVLTQIVGYFHFLLSLFFLWSFINQRSKDNLLNLFVMLLFVSNTQIYEWIGRIYPETFIILYFWLFIWILNKQHKSSSDWFVTFLLFSILCISKLVYLTLILLIIIQFKKEYKQFLRKKHRTYWIGLGVIGGLLPLVWYLKFYTTVDLKDVEKLFDFDYGTRFNESWIDVIKKGLGLIPFKVGSNKVDGIPALITIVFPKTGFRSWSMSLILLILLVLPGFKRGENSNRYLYLILSIVLISFTIAGTGFARYWIPVFPLFFYFWLTSIIDLMPKVIGCNRILIISLVYSCMTTLNNIRILIGDINNFNW